MLPIHENDSKIFWGFPRTPLGVFVNVQCSQARSSNFVSSIMILNSRANLIQLSDDDSTRQQGCQTPEIRTIFAAVASVEAMEIYAFQRVGASAMPENPLTLEAGNSAPSPWRPFEPCIADTCSGSEFVRSNNFKNNHDEQHQKNN